MTKSIINILKKINENIVEIIGSSFLVFLILIFFGKTIERYTLSITDNERIYNLVGSIYLTIYSITTITLILSIWWFLYKKLGNIIFILTILIAVLIVFPYIMRV